MFSLCAGTRNGSSKELPGLVIHQLIDFWISPCFFWHPLKTGLASDPLKLPPPLLSCTLPFSALFDIYILIPELGHLLLCSPRGNRIFLYLGWPYNFKGQQVWGRGYSPDEILSKRQMWWCVLMCPDMSFETGKPLGTGGPATSLSWFWLDLNNRSRDGTKVYIWMWLCALHRC